MINHGFIVACLVLSAGVTMARADDPPVFSGPQVGERLSPLHVVIAVGKQRGDEIDFIEAAKGKPTVLFFVNGSNRPAGSLGRVLMHYAEMQSPDDLYAAVVWLSDDRSSADKFLNRTLGSWGVESPVGISVDGTEGPGTYGLNRNVNVTVLVANNNRVTANYPLIQPSLADAPKILADVVKQAGGNVPTMAEIDFLSRAALTGGPVPWAKAPTDIELRRRVCALLAAADEAEADAAAAKIEELVGDNAELIEQLKDTVRVLSPTKSQYEIPFASPQAAKHVEQWRDEYDVAAHEQRAMKRKK